MPRWENLYIQIHYLWYNNQEIMKKYFLIITISLTCLSSCSLGIDPLIRFLRNENKGKAIINTPSESGTIGSIDIPSPGYFWLLRPWKKGKLATMDGKARFAEISFSGKNRMRITSLVNFPKEPINRMLITAPEAGICITRMRWMFYIADIVNKKTKKYMPLTQWRFHESYPEVLDEENGIVYFGYYATGGYKEQHIYNIIYDVKNDKTLYESPEDGEENEIIYPFSTELFLCENYIWDETQDYWKRQKYFLYNWKTKEIFQNELTKFLTDKEEATILSRGENINVKERYMFADFPIPGEKISTKKAKITWDENYENVKVISLDYLINEKQHLCDFYISSDGKWATVDIGGYMKDYGDYLYQTVFFHLDSRYPNGMSIPIFTEGYGEHHFGGGAFFEHPEYGWCFAVEKYKEDKKGNDKLYLRLYKMDDVLAEINRQLSEKAEGVSK
jgi:hypothetical protein